MKSRTLLLYISDHTYRQHVSRLLSDAGRTIVASDRPKSAQMDVDQYDPDVILSLVGPEDAADVIADCSRAAAARPAGVSVVAIVRDADTQLLQRILAMGAEDVLRYPVEDIELSVRVEAAFIRLEGRERLLADRDFYRAAVKQEEYLSSLALERSVDVQSSYRKLAMVNDKLREQIQRLTRIARVDPLSGLMNRMSLYDVADTEVERALRNDEPLCGIMIDVDHFKQVNDNHGHHCGDRVIRYLGRFLRQRLRRYDAAGRYGGEEFFVILPNTRIAQAWQFATRFRQNLEATVIACESSEIAVTASSGIAEYRSGEPRDSWIARADRAMYAAKQRGRNRVEIEPSQGSPGRESPDGGSLDR